MKKQLFLFLIAILLLVGCQNQSPGNQDNSSNKLIKENLSSSTKHHEMTNIASEKEFIEKMIPHHQEAIDTSKLILEQTSDNELKTFTQQVIEAQTKEVEQMKSLYREWFGSEYKTDNTYIAMMPNLKNISKSEADKAYIQGMIKHHQGAISMAQQLKTFTKRPELLTMADNIINSQAREMELLESWL